MVLVRATALPKYPQEVQYSIVSVFFIKSILSIYILYTYPFRGEDIINK